MIGERKDDPQMSPEEFNEQLRSLFHKWVEKPEETKVEGYADSLESAFKRVLAFSYLPPSLQELLSYDYYLYSYQRAIWSRPEELGEPSANETYQLLRLDSTRGIFDPILAKDIAAEAIKHYQKEQLQLFSQFDITDPEPLLITARDEYIRMHGEEP